MIQKKFENISDFISFRTQCIFCGEPLKSRLTNYVILDYSGISSLINSKLTDNHLVFNIKYTSISTSVDSVGSIDIQTNEISFHPNKTNNAEYNETLRIFEQFKPHISSRCTNKNCKTFYSINSDFLTCEKSLKQSGEYKNFSINTRIYPFRAYFESVTIDRYLVQSDWIYNVTRIVPINNYESEPLVIPFINFSDFDKDKLKTRVSTLVIFS